MMAIFIAASTTQAYCNDKRCVGVIQKLYISPAVGEVLIQTDQPQGNLNCTQHSGIYLTLKKEPNNLMFDEMYRALLLAKASKQNINLRIVPNTTNCEIHYIVLE